MGFKTTVGKELDEENRKAVKVIFLKAFSSGRWADTSGYLWYHKVSKNTAHTLSSYFVRNIIQEQVGYLFMNNLYQIFFHENIKDYNFKRREAERVGW